MGLRNFPLSVARFILKKLDDSFSLQKSFEHFECLRFTCTRSIKHTVIGLWIQYLNPIYGTGIR